jgi:hypothetical protein
MMARMADGNGTLELLVGARGGDHLSVRITGRVHPAATGFWEANWLKARVAARAGAFHGAFDADLRCDELEAFATQLRALAAAAQGTARLESAEGWVTLKLSLDPRGRLQGSCEVRDDPTGGGALRFGLTAEPDQPRALLAALDAILEAFPVVGDPAEEGGALLAELGEGDDSPGDA